MLLKLLLFLPHHRAPILVIFSLIMVIKVQEVVVTIIMISSLIMVIKVQVVVIRIRMVHISVPLATEVVVVVATDLLVSFAANMGMMLIRVGIDLIKPLCHHQHLHNILIRLYFHSLNFLLLETFLCNNKDHHRVHHLSNLRVHMWQLSQISLLI